MFGRALGAMFGGGGGGRGAVGGMRPQGLQMGPSQQMSPPQGPLPFGAQPRPMGPSSPMVDKMMAMKQQMAGQQMPMGQQMSPPPPPPQMPQQMMPPQQPPMGPSPMMMNRMGMNRNRM